ncbi:MAG: hypothetical protein CMF96_11080 [Candidatus Marinimicrobia bacterium]|nr:hypothetical protein [Candidatus Neomarinimicrobiota bacterium]|tara:strand:- start:7390 stop:7944 length:555 start_codon:yes stop_codon:yes gene_type:complete
MNQTIDKLNKNLIQKVLIGDKSATLKFIKLAEPFVWGALLKYEQLSGEEREDLFQEIFLKLFNKNNKRIKMWKEKSKFSTYLYMITINTTLDFLKSAAYNRSKKYTSMDTLKIKSQKIELADLYSLKQAISILNSSEKKVIKLYYYEQLKEKEIAKILNKSINTISSLKYRAIKKMKIFLKELE